MWLVKPFDVQDVVFLRGFTLVYFPGPGATVSLLIDIPNSFGDGINNGYQLLLGSSDTNIVYRAVIFCFDNLPLRP